LRPSLCGRRDAPTSLFPLMGLIAMHECFAVEAGVNSRPAASVVASSPAVENIIALAAEQTVWANVRLLRFAFRRDVPA
jgi:hypothetical protein